jgi:hypothetical protein
VGEKQEPLLGSIIALVHIRCGSCLSKLDLKREFPVAKAYSSTYRLLPYCLK